MAGNNRKKRVDDRPGYIVCISRCAIVIKKIWVAVGKPSVHTFFLWSSLIFLVCGLATVVFCESAHDFFCAVRPQSQYGGQGCESLSSELLLCGKGDCWRNAANVTYQVQADYSTKPLFQKFSVAALDPICNEIVKSRSVTNAIEMIVRIQKTTSTNPAWARKEIDACKAYHCGIFVTSLTNPDLTSTVGADTCSNSFGSKTRAHSSKCVCENFLAYDGFVANELATASTEPTSVAMKAIKDMCEQITIDTMFSLCSSTAGVYPIWCPVKIVPASSPASGTTAVMPVVGSATTDTETTTVVRRLEGNVAGDHVEANAILNSEINNQQHLSLEVTAEAEISMARWGNASSIEQRRLAENDDLEDYETQKWSRCTCYQQCTSGIRTRTVSCGAEACKAPKPSEKETCTCGHGAQCIIHDRLISLFIIYFIQAGFAIIVFLCYLRTLSHTEDHFIKMGIMRKCGGLFYKQFPPLIRLLVLVQLVQIIWIVVDVWLMKVTSEHTDKWQKDCFASKDLQKCSILIAVLWIVQVLMGRCTTTYARKPDWLYSPNRASRRFPIKQIRKCLNCLGP